MNSIEDYKKALAEIELYYGDKTTTRSGIKLINHINEGCAIIYNLNPENKWDLMASFCLHPLTQNYGDDYQYNYDHNPNILKDAKDYAMVANHYLCRESTDHISNLDDVIHHMDSISKDYHRDSIWVLLYADKVQNKKDFEAYHLNHKRSKELSNYFDLWIDFTKMKLCL